MWPDAFSQSAIAIDPSKGKEAKRGDYSAIVFAGIARGLLWVDADIRRRPVSDIVIDGIEFYRQYRPDLFGIEANAFQELMGPEFDRAAAEAGIVLPLVLLNNTIKKEIRIRRIGPYLAGHKIRFRQTQGCRILVQQLREFLVCDHDDGPDALEMAIRLLQPGVTGGGDQETVIEQVMM